MKEAEILIAGGGFVGTALALATARLGFAVLLVEAGDAPPDAEEDPRASMLSASSRALLERLGVLAGMETRLQPVWEMLVSHGARSEVGGEASPFFVAFAGAGKARKEPLAWMLENRHLRAGMAAALRQNPEVRRLAPARVARCTAVAHNRSEVRLEDGRRLLARLCIATDGANSQLRGDAGIETSGWRYEGSALTAVIAHEWEHDGVAQEHFMPAGPFAILPLPGRRSSLVWVETAEAAAALTRCPQEIFLAEAWRRMGDHSGEMRLEGRRLAYPIGLQLARRYGAPGLLLAGDAAHVVHPLAGQGLNMGLKDVIALEELLRESRRLGLAADAGLLLERYERKRRFDNLAMAMVTDGTQRLFHGDGAILRLLRDLCLGTAQASERIRALGERLAA